MYKYFNSSYTTFIKGVIRFCAYFWRWQTVENFNDKIKFEVINELGLMDKVKNFGWKSLTAKETGRIGGLITKKKKTMQMEESQQA